MSKHRKDKDRRKQNRPSPAARKHPADNAVTQTAADSRPGDAAAGAPPVRRPAWGGELQVRFLSAWVIATGTGSGYAADNRLVRDADGLPFLPGRALKGALREGAELLGRCADRPDLARACRWLFGSAPDEDAANRPGCLCVDEGRLPAAARSLLISREARARGWADDLVCYRTATKIRPDGTRQVEAGSLRRLECGCPGLVFTAGWEIVRSRHVGDGILPPPAWWRQYLRAVAAAVRSMGGGRARGLGQCRITVDGEAGKVTLPPVWQGESS